MSRPTERDPLRELLGVQRRMNDLFESALARANFETGEGVGAWSPVADVTETGEALVVQLELPGLEQSEIGLRVEAEMALHGDPDAEVAG